jgi:hypothetical protein
VNTIKFLTDGESIPRTSPMLKFAKLCNDRGAVRATIFRNGTDIYDGDIYDPAGFVDISSY